MLWRNGTMSDLGGLGTDFGRAESINEQGDIAGLAVDAAAGQKHAVVWTAGPRPQ